MMQVGDNILNFGYSFGLNYPLIYGKQRGQWCIWNRHTGVVVYVEQETNPCLMESVCSRKCEELNQVPAIDDAMRDALDTTP